MKFTIVGGGFGGVKAALELAKHTHNHITLISDKDDFQYFPALYGTATGRSHLQSWVPLGEIFAGMFNVDVIIDTVTNVDPKKKQLLSSHGNTYHYEHLILALGTVTTYFGIEGLDHFAYGIKSEAEITRLKQHFFKQMSENKELEKHYVIIGGGPTGVELASALGTYIKYLRKHYGLKSEKVDITLVEASPRLLPRMHPAVSKRVEARMKKIGVGVETNKRVESATAEGLMVNGKPLSSHTIIWTSGVANHPFFAANAEHFELSKNGRVVVNHYMRTKSGIYVIGDNAFTPFSGLAQTALHDAQFIAENFERRQRNKLLRKYKSVLPPVVVPLGEDWAAFEWKFIRMYGWPAAVIRQAADFIGYHDILPIGRALGPWRAQKVYEDDYFTPTAPAE